jgi:hypothetical protein
MADQSGNCSRRKPPCRPVMARSPTVARDERRAWR